MRRAIQEVLPEAVWQRCYVHFLRNALDYLPRKADDDCLQELRWIYDRRDAQEARRDLAAWLLKWGKRYAKLCAWVEENIEETFSFYRLPRQHHKNLKSTNMLERLMEEIKRRTLVVRIFPNAADASGSCARWPSRYTKTGSKPCSTSIWIHCRSKRKKRCGIWEMRRDGFYEANQGKALKSRPRPGPPPGFKGPVSPTSNCRT